MKLIIYDFDGVLVDTKNLYYDIHNILAPEYGLKEMNSPLEYLDIIDNNSLEKVLSEARIKQFYTEANAIYERYLDKIKMYKWMKKLCLESTNGIVIITSTYSKYVEKVLNNNGIVNNYEILGKELKPSKRERLEYYVDKHNINKEDIIYVGDTINDYLFCQSVGIEMIGSNYGYSDLQQIGTNLIKLVNSDKELYDYVKNI